MYQPYLLLSTKTDSFDIWVSSVLSFARAQAEFKGYSYGTLLGNVIARQFGARVDRMVLDGNIDPNSYYYGRCVL